MPAWALPAFSWLISFYFLFGFVADLGFPPRSQVSGGDLLFAALWLLFLFLPFFKKVKIGPWLELEREVERTRNELADFKTEVRSSLSVISTNINTIGNLSNQVTVNFPGAAELADVKERLDRLSQPETAEEAKEIRDEIASIDGEDRIMALARTRIRLEYLLRELLGKRTSVEGELQPVAVKFMSLSQLVREFTARYPQKKELGEPIRYVFDVCNAAMHAQRVSASQAEQALEVGARVLAILSDLRLEVAGGAPKSKNNV